MQFLRIFKLLTVSVLYLCIGQSCTKKKAVAPLKPQTVLIDANFTSQSLNERVLVCTNLSEKDLNRNDLKAWIRKNAVTVSQKKDAILAGSYLKYPEAWFYTQIINTDTLNKQLVVDENNRIRCDGFEVFTVKDRVAKNWGNIDRLTSFSKYPIPFLTYAVPFNIGPKDTLNLLIHTTRRYGRHEVNLGIWSYQTYMGEHIFHFLDKIFQIILFSICTLMMFILGGIFRFKTMTYLGYFLLSLLLIHLTSWGFIDAFLIFKGIGLSADNVSVITVFVANVLVHPFLMEWMKGIPKNNKVFNGISYFLVAISSFAICCFFAPKNIFLTLNDVLHLPQLMTITVLMGIIWFFYCSFLAIFRAKIYYMLFGFTVAYLPFLFQQLNGILFEKSNFVAQVYHPSFVLAAIGLSTISIFLLREQLVTRKIYEKNLTQLKETMEGIRKSEVETIGRNLHDQVGNTLASALGYLNLKTLKLDVVQKLIMDAINEIRFLSHNLVKDEDKPITEKIEALVGRFNDFSTINFQYSDFSNAKINSLEPHNQQNIYMIIQEIMTNIVKHSKATEAYIQIFENEENIAINIEDDGIGMANLNENKGIGLKNIQKRVEVSKLQITSDSTPNGTNFIIEIPYGNSNNNH
jgi:signal transduction histidine kinase